MKKYIRCAEDVDNTFNDALSNLKEDFDYIVSGLEKLDRSGPNASQTGLAIIENISNSLSGFISDIANTVEGSDSEVQSSQTITADDDITFKDRYLHDLIGDIQSEFSYDIPDITFDTHDNALQIDGHCDDIVINIKIPYAELHFDFDRLDADVDYVANLISEECNREYVDECQAIDAAKVLDHDLTEDEIELKVGKIFERNHIDPALDDAQWLIDDCVDWVKADSSNTISEWWRFAKLDFASEIRHLKELSSK